MFVKKNARMTDDQMIILCALVWSAEAFRTIGSAANKLDKREFAHNQAYFVAGNEVLQASSISTTELKCVG
jgi:hypothetical protein